ncbi:TatD family hydrolase [Zwartia panacis]|jgi:TatD DNase family protein|uniref:TatD family hydrolase n=1 Tax=Zwartia panacis TaxID=2683345 RepID=UPI0025B41DFD|nr:TatD family hydrolase [Zwartia panacis]MDN4016791.1 TatD family hydrolase [Zwartia panacis]
MFVDSHCHVNFPELAAQMPDILQKMNTNSVGKALCVSVNLPDWPDLINLVEQHEALYASVGVHPDYEDTIEPTVEDLVERSHHPKVIAIGETGLDYYRLSGDLSWQRQRFRRHIQAAKQTKLPLIIHTRASSEDTLNIMREEGAQEARGVMHCFTESWEVAQASMDMGFYISFSGIVTFKKATELQEVARRMPLDRILIETDSPYLAPVPHRGKLNDPSKVIHVAEMLASLRNVKVSEIEEASTLNFFNLFNKIKH